MTREDETRAAGALFEQLVAHFGADPDVTQGTGFGSYGGLRVAKRIFAIFGPDYLVLKLPAGRVDELIASGVGARFESGRGRPMKEWVTVPVVHGDEWQRLAVEAHAFVAGRGERRHGR